MKLYQSKKFWLCVVEIVIVILLIIGLVLTNYAGGIIGKIHFVDFDKGEAGINSDLDEETLKTMSHYTNIAIFGLDNRSAGNYENGNSDVIMIASINNDTKDIKLVSVYRDTCLNVGAEYGGINKANSAYAFGGVKNAVQTLNANLDLNITDFVAVDWNAVTEVVDALGGVQIQIDESEVQYINFYIDEINQKLGRNSSGIYSSGLQTLDGVQATAYCRIRYTSGDDFRRTSRQRIVMEALLNGAKQASLSTLTDIATNVFDDVYTSFELPEIISLISDVKNYKLESTTGFPFQCAGSNMFYTCLVPISLESNVSQLHEYLFGTKNYKPSETVKSISQMIYDTTGLNDDASTFDTSIYNDTTGKNSAFD